MGYIDIMSQIHIIILIEGENLLILLCNKIGCRKLSSPHDNFCKGFFIVIMNGKTLKLYIIYYHNKNTIITVCVITINNINSNDCFKLGIINVYLHISSFTKVINSV